MAQKHTKVKFSKRLQESAVYLLLNSKRKTKNYGPQISQFSLVFLTKNTKIILDGFKR